MATDAVSPSPFGQLPAELRRAAGSELERYERQRVASRLWERDPGLWPHASPAEIRERLGWLQLPAQAADVQKEGERLREQADGEDVRSFLLVGMGGSSLGAIMLTRLLEGGPGHPLEFAHCDTTHPDAIEHLLRRLDPAATWLVVATKSGTTVETLSLAAAFQDWLRLAGRTPARQSIAITDSGSPLERRAEAEAWRAVVNPPRDLGGRYSVLSAYGLLAPLLTGRSVDRLMAGARRMAERCDPSTLAGSHPAAHLAAHLAAAARPLRRLVLVIEADERRRVFGEWLEQLLAESTGKDGAGILPLVAPERLARGPDDERVELRLDSASPSDSEASTSALATDESLGESIFLWEFATALLGWSLAVLPFDQPDVERAKRATRESIAGTAAPVTPPIEATSPELPERVAEWVARCADAVWVGVQAFLPPGDGSQRGLAALSGAVGGAIGRAVGWAYGPRYLHSTGQLQKGGPPHAILQLVDRPQSELPVPGQPYTFAQLLRAQADGDARALGELGRPLLRVDLGGDREEGLAAVRAAIESASG